MAYILPDFLNIKFLTGCLQQEFGDSTIVTHFESEPAVPEGWNFSSSVTRVKCFYKRGKNEDVETTSLFVKAPKQQEFIDMVFTEECKEQYFYSNIVPKLSHLYKVDYVPKTYDCGNPLVLVMEDLNSKGFKVPDKRDQFDFDHCKLYIQSAAKLQASSIVVGERDPKYFENYKSNNNKIFNNNERLRKINTNIASVGANSLADSVRGLSQYEGIVDILDKVSRNLWNLVIVSGDTENALNSLIQFDVWPPNFMFKYDQLGNVKSVKLLDFQMYSFSPAVIDIILFLWKCANSEVRECRLNELLNIYVDTLNGLLSDLGSSTRLSFSQLKEQLEILSPWALFTVCFHLPFSQLKDPMPIETLFEYCENEPKKYYDVLIKEFKNPSTVFPSVLLHLEAQGVFESISKLYIK
uniref:CHK kinase-like domain-containing protein n=1 Tax=Cuerna arida TaxID=1464854 RepID=A0A1B6G623_9HEMI